ncbi:MAG: SMP-30/gluconolactonase/LRE family protein [Bryobacterales bacterium]|nr:SMP-30/gluconolactonase/LRE family protein [Bryobacterales bacterium]
MIALVALLLAAPLLPAEEYTLGPDSQRQPGVPKGTVTQHQWTSKIFPGTVRDYWVYVPAQYDASKPAPVVIFQDGQGVVREDSGFRAPVVMDNLIHKKEMPAAIGIFISPGVLPAQTPEQQGRYNRSFEYDAVSDRYARFLIEEILPEVGKKYNLSKDPNDRAIAGSSSGGIAAFVAAWQRPDQFRRVISFIGSYTNLRGGDALINLIRKTEPKPLRVFLQDGSGDQSIYSGNWWQANQAMANSLEYAGYDVTFVKGTEAHNGKHGSAILPDAMRWVWRGYPAPVRKSVKGGERMYVMDFLKPESDWQLLSEGHRFTEGPAVDKQGNVFFTDIPNNRIHKIAPDGKVSVFKEDSGATNGLKFGPDGRLYGCQNGRKRIVAWGMDGTETVIAEGVNSNDLVINAKGEIYFTEPPTKKVWFIDAKGNKRVVIERGLEFPNGIALSPDQSLLTVADTRGKVIWSYQIQPDGSLANGVAYYRLETPDESQLFSIADGMTVDTEGHLYVTTILGVQICDQPGRVVGIINKPHGGPLSNVVFGGPNQDWLYVTAGDRVYRRQTNRKGVNAWTTIKPPQPRL